MNAFLCRLFASAVVIASVVLAPPAAAQLSAIQSFEKSDLEIHGANGSRKFTVELARTPQQQSQGLMFRRRLAPDAGMLFVYSQPETARFWMKNTYIPLDILFIASDGRIARIAERTVPLSTATVASDGPVIAVLELNAGTAHRLGIKPGDRVIHPALGTAK